MKILNKQSLLFFLILFIGGTAVSASIYSVGYVPISFPRDPLEVNQYDEHVILGQILEPLVDTDSDGQLVPSIAKSWTFSKDGKTIEFLIDTQIQFSNGKHVTPADVVFSLRRHLVAKSQSSGFLENVENVISKSSDSVVITLKNADVSILKALSRDQLGIMPDGWQFKADSMAPFIGTGAYQLVKERNEWHLEENKFHKHSEIMIKKWKLIFFSDANFAVPAEIPDLMPDVTFGVLEQVKKNPSFAVKKLEVSSNLGFTQTSFWVHPQSRLYNSVEKRRAVQKLLNEIIETYCMENNLSRSTGMIPIGIQGSISKAAKIETYRINHNKFVLKIAAPAGIFSTFFTTERLQQIEIKYGVQIKMFFRSPGELKTMHEWHPDIVAGSWAGGFNDPTGFLSLLVGILGIDFPTYLGSKQIIFRQAQSEQDWKKRSDHFQVIGSYVISEALLTPGWRVPTFEVRNKKIKPKKFQTRYTPRLENFAEEEPLAN